MRDVAVCLRVYKHLLTRGGCASRQVSSFVYYANKQRFGGHHFERPRALQG